MSRTYANLVVRGEAAPVASVLAGTGVAALVGPTRAGWTGVFPDDSDYDFGVVDVAAAIVTRELDTVALTAVVHDDQVLLSTLVVRGDRVDDLASGIEHFQADVPATTYDVGVLADVVTPAADAADLADVLDGDYPTQSQRYAELLRMLGLPGYVAGVGYRDLRQGALPDGVARSELRETGAG